MNCLTESKTGRKTTQLLVESPTRFSLTECNNPFPIVAQPTASVKLSLPGAAARAAACTTRKADEAHMAGPYETQWRRVCIAVMALTAALTSAFDLAVHTVNLCQHVFGPGLHLQVG